MKSAPQTPPVTLPDRDVYTVSRLNREARMLLERAMPALWIEGELSNFSAPSSGHWYFSLRDASAQVRCAMFRQRNQMSLCKPRDGLHVLARVRVSLYEPRGEYQLLVDHLEEAGEGALRRRFDALKARLQQEGLFAAERKRALPALPKRIGVITSPSGAAIRDILHVLRRRFCGVPVLVYPVPVQGAGAAAQIAAMIRLASARAECDVLIVARGGGSLEDLWAFNEEVVARALFDCRIPTVSGVGHEIDVTIADFVADVRAPTPSAAAELIAPNCEEWLERLVVLSRRATHCMQRTLQDRRVRSEWLARRLAQAHPGVRLRHQAQRVDDFEQRFKLAIRTTLARASSRLHGAQRQLVALSPLATLERGYAIVTRVGDGAVLRSSGEVKPGAQIEARLSQGRVRARVEDKD
jgi:exodeoxyribonuclease VII large subunit